MLSVSASLGRNRRFLTAVAHCICPYRRRRQRVLSSQLQQVCHHPDDVIEKLMRRRIYILGRVTADCDVLVQRQLCRLPRDMDAIL